MRRIISIAREDFDALLKGWAGIALVLLLPTGLLLMAGQLQTGKEPTRILITGVPAKADARDAKAARLRELVRALREHSGVKVTAQRAMESDPLTSLRAGRYDLVLSYGEAGSKDLSVYTAEIDPGRLPELDRTAAGILRADALLRVPGGGIEVPIDPLAEYYPQAADPRLQRLPDVMVLVLCLLPFVLAVAADRSGEGPLSGGENSRPSILLDLAGRCVLPSAAAASSLLWMLVLAQSFYGLEVKAGVFRCLFFLLPALVTSSLLGQWVAAASRSNLGRLAAAMTYVLATLFLCGFIVPLAKSTAIVRNLAYLLPATQVRPMFGAWSFGAAFSWQILEPLAILLAEALVYGILAGLALSRRKSVQAR